VRQDNHLSDKSLTWQSEMRCAGRAELTKQLLEKGYNVRGTVRDKTDTAKVITRDSTSREAPESSIAASCRVDGPSASEVGYNPDKIRLLRLTAEAVVQLSAPHLSCGVQTGHLLALGHALPGKLELWDADLLTDGSFDEVFR